ncbi:MAG: type III pantothenate kinase [Alphaproteobacteria bacterium]|nr:type III pantothenate kinase [Alphaproteobacteria bacterium]MDP6517729.1 type III pantothenate kinase [Alphaproteobacteria bacterium]
MLLTVDAGNTNVVFAVFDGERLTNRWRISTEVKRTADEYAVWLTQLMALDHIGPDDIGDAVIATVVPQALHAIAGLCRSYFDCDPLVIDNGGAVGIAINIAHPREVGADRLVNAVAAHRRFPGWLIVIDFGTATTLDVISAEGSYEGGIIAPGVNLSLDALDRAAAKLPRIAVERPERVIGTGTVSAMQSGVYWGYVGLIEGLVARIKHEIGQPMTTVATGGLAALFKDAIDSIDAVAADLTLHGLRHVHDHNRGPTGP